MPVKLLYEQLLTMIIQQIQRIVVIEKFLNMQSHVTIINHNKCQTIHMCLLVVVHHVHIRVATDMREIERVV